MADDKLNQSDIDALIAKVRGGSASSGGASSDSQNPLDKLGITQEDLTGLKKLFETSIEASTEVLRSITQKNVTVESISEINVAGRRELSKKITPPYVATKVDYVVGIRGLDILLMTSSDLSNLMKLQFESMGYTPDENDTEFMMSASNEVMNQMMGNASNKLGNELGIFIDISTPDSQMITVDESNPEATVEIPFLKEDELSYVFTTFRLNIEGQVSGDLIKVLDSDFIEELRTIMKNKESQSDGMDAGGMHTGENGETLSSFETSQRHIDMMRQSSANNNDEVQDTPTETISPTHQIANESDTQQTYEQQMQQMQQQMQQMQQMQMQMNPNMYAQPQMNPNMYAQPQMNPNMYAQPMYDPNMFAASQQMPAPTNVVHDSSVEVSKFELPYLNPVDNASHQRGTTNRVKSVQVEMTVELGRTRMTVKDILELDKGSIIELNRLAGEHIDLYCNGTLVAKGEVVVIKDNFAFRVLSIVDQDYR